MHDVLSGCLFMKSYVFRHPCLIQAVNEHLNSNELSVGVDQPRLATPGKPISIEFHVTLISNNHWM